MQLKLKFNLYLCYPTLLSVIISFRSAYLEPKFERK